MNPFHPVFILLAVVLLGCAIAVDGAKKKGPGGLPGIVSADGVQIPFFCSLTGERFARLTLTSIQPARQRVGPFAVATPGYDVRGPRLWISSYECALEDWHKLLSMIEPRNGLDVRGGMDLLLPGGETFSAARLLHVDGAFVSFETGDGDGARILSLAHDGNRIYHHFRPKPTVSKK